MESIEIPTAGGSIQMPSVGLGCWQIDTPEPIRAALDSGYRMIDTAILYGNECIVGDVLKEKVEAKTISREDIFVSSKLPGVFMGSREHVREAVERSLQNLKLDHVDMYALHWPCGFQYTGDGTCLVPFSAAGTPLHAHHDLAGAWRALEECVEDGLVTAIGVSNFNSKQLQRIIDISRVPVANLQVEAHAYFQQRDLVTWCRDKGVSVTAFAPLGSPGRIKEVGGDPIHPMSDSVVVEIAKKHAKTPAQILLRSLVQRGIAVVPKSSSASRISENRQIFDFELDGEDCKRIEALDKKQRTFVVDIWKGHPEYPFDEPF